MEGAAVTDRELLEKAARAAGYTLGNHSQCGWLRTLGGRVWNPLTDDGDALRLAARLRLKVGSDGQSLRPVVECWQAHSILPGVAEPEGEDAATAYRRAIVRAAAAIGESMPAAEPDSPRDLRFVPYAIQPAADPIAPAILKDSP